MPRPFKYSPISDRMPSPYRGERTSPRGADLLKLIKESPVKVEESWGACKNTVKKVRRGSTRVPKCKAYKAVLGNGLCQDCWDKAIDARANQRKYADEVIPPNDPQ